MHRRAVPIIMFIILFVKAILINVPLFVLLVQFGHTQGQFHNQYIDIANRPPQTA